MWWFPRDSPTSGTGTCETHDIILLCYIVYASPMMCKPLHGSSPKRDHIILVCMMSCSIRMLMINTSNNSSWYI